MKTILPLLAVLATALVQLGCNPNCRSLQNLQISTNSVPDGYEFAIRATPMNSLLDRVITIGGIRVDPSGYHEDYGLAVKVPEGLSGPQTLRIEDPDCLDFYEIDLNVVDLNDFNTLETFVPPIPPTFIFPVTPPVFPGTINDAWLSPEDPGYCLWFTMLFTVDPATMDTTYTNIIDPNNSFEQSTCPCLQTSNLPYAQNHMSGFIDTVGGNNTIQVFIHRSNGTERFSGMFIDMDETVYPNNLGLLNCPDPCLAQDVSIPGSGQMLLLTSQKTGKQVAAYQVKP